MTIEYNDNGTAYVPLNDLPKAKILIDLNSIKFVTEQKFAHSCHSPPRWYWSEKFGQIYTIDTNENQRYFYDLVFGKKVHDNLKFIGKHGEDYYDFTLKSVKERKQQFKIDDCEIITKCGYTVPTMGRYAGQEKNQIYRVRAQGGEIRYYMHCHPDIYVRISETSVKNISVINIGSMLGEKTIIWYGFKHGWIAGDYEKDNKYHRTYLHLKLMNKIDSSINDVIFINNNKMDFRLENLKLHNEPEKKIDPKIEIENDKLDINNEEVINMSTSKSISESKKEIQYVKDYDTINGHKVVKRYKGTIKTEGTYTYQEKNPVFKCKTQDGESIYYMYCECGEDGAFTRIDKNKMNVIRYRDDNTPITWYKEKDSVDQSGKTRKGYVIGRAEKNTLRYLHQYLTNHYGHGKGQDSVDHANKDKLDNRTKNLRIVSQSVQNSNMDKKERQCIAKDLPDGITQKMIPIHITYNKECYNPKEKDLDKRRYREFFRIEKFGTFPKDMTSSKSSKVSITDKLNQVKEMLKNHSLGLPIKPTPDGIQYPLYVRDGNDRGVPALFFERRIDGKRQNFTRRMQSDDGKAEYKMLQEGVLLKYGYQLPNLE